MNCFQVYFVERYSLSSSTEMFSIFFYIKLIVQCTYNCLNASFTSDTYLKPVIWKSKITIHSESLKSFNVFYTWEESRRNHLLTRLTNFRHWSKQYQIGKNDLILIFWSHIASNNPLLNKIIRSRRQFQYKRLRLLSVPPNNQTECVQVCSKSWWLQLKLGGEHSAWSLGQ